MKRLVSAAAAVSMLLVLGTGCANKKPAENPAAVNSAPLDVSPAATPAYQPAPIPVAPAISETPAMAAPAATPAAGSTYVVKKGDTLYSIAKAHYGDGKQWQKIISANPGVDSKHLKVGQKLIMP